MESASAARRNLKTLGFRCALCRIIFTNNNHGEPGRANILLRTGIDQTESIHIHGRDKISDDMSATKVLELSGKSLNCTPPMVSLTMCSNLASADIANWMDRECDRSCCHRCLQRRNWRTYRLLNRFFDQAPVSIKSIVSPGAVRLTECQQTVRSPRPVKTIHE